MSDLNEDAVAEFHRRAAELRDLQRRLGEVSGTAVSPRRLLTVTAGHGGAVQRVTFSGDGYKRMAPTELADLVLTTVRQAQDAAAAEAAQVIAPTLPDGLDAGRLMRGELDLTEALPRPVLDESDARPQTVPGPQRGRN